MKIRLGLAEPRTELLAQPSDTIRAGKIWEAQPRAEHQNPSVQVRSHDDNGETIVSAVRYVVHEVRCDRPGTRPYLRQTDRPHHLRRIRGGHRKPWQPAGMNRD